MILVPVLPLVTLRVSSPWFGLVPLCGQHTEVAFLNLNNELTETEIMKIPLIIAPKTIKCLGINLSQKGKDLYTEN